MVASPGPRDRASTRTIVVRWMALAGVVSIVGALTYRQCTGDLRREGHARAGVKCLLGVDQVARADLRAKLDEMAARAKSHPRGAEWPAICARAFAAASRGREAIGRTAEARAASVRDAIGTGELSNIETALAPYAE